MVPARKLTQPEGKTIVASYDFGRLKKINIIYLVMQIILTLLFILIGMQFQPALGRELFTKSITFSIVIQLALFYPLIKAAQKEVAREVDASVPGLTPEQVKQINKRRTYADIIKTGVFMFFFAAMFAMPEKLSQYPSANRMIFSITIYTFFLTVISYSQYFTYYAKKKIRELS